MNACEFINDAEPVHCDEIVNMHADLEKGSVCEAKSWLQG